MFKRLTTQFGAFLMSYYLLIGLGVLLAIVLIGWYDIWCAEVGLCGGSETE